MNNKYRTNLIDTQIILSKLETRDGISAIRENSLMSCVKDLQEALSFARGMRSLAYHINGPRQSRVEVIAIVMVVAVRKNSVWFRRKGTFSSRITGLFVCRKVPLLSASCFKDLQQVDKYLYYCGMQHPPYFYCAMWCYAAW